MLILVMEMQDQCCAPFYIKLVALDTEEFLTNF